MIEMRLVDWSDRDVIADLSETLVEEMYGPFKVSRQKVHQTVASAIREASPTIFVAEEDGEILGFLAATMQEYWFTTGIFVSQDVLYVRPDKRGTRVAVKLLKEFIRWGDMLGAREHIFGTMTDYQPERTARLFERMGARRVGYYLKRENHG